MTTEDALHIGIDARRRMAWNWLLIALASVELLVTLILLIQLWIVD
ncbi:hypothetical protein LP420_23750 [Massilia sp. B-10]|nr:hypothetical protein LP420_23750 [Massilia sp. B-10]UUZ52411.1 hypothetical protein LP419_23215 [Massilia sp. H-1]